MDEWTFLFLFNLKTALNNDENVIAGGKYRDEETLRSSYAVKTRVTGIIRARHKNANKRMKQFGVLGNRF